MSLLVFQDVSLALGGKAIVDGLDLRIGDRERIGLVGPNGSGKSTILRLIAGEQAPDGGQIQRPRGLRIGYLPQDVEVEGGCGLLAFVRESVPGRAELDRALESATLELEAAESDGSRGTAHEERMLELAGRVAELHEEVAHFDAHYSEFEAKGILAGLGFKPADLDRDLDEFSGGWKMRAVLAALLFQRPDLLLLDEPTNHLDMPSVAWFSGFLRRYERSFVLISHDREFLNEQIRRVVSLEPEGVRSYQGDYEQYRRQREEERVLLEGRAKNLEREREHLEQFIKRFRAKATKAAQVQSRVRALEKMETIELHRDRAVMSFRFPPCERAGKDVLLVENLSKSYGDRSVLSDLSLRVERGDRIALLGVNGAGKTTLLRVLAGEIEPSAGTFTFGHNTKPGYYAQHHAESLDPARTVYEEVARCCREGGHQRIRAVLGAMLFGDLEVEKKVGVLSGGERARVALSQLLIDPGNVLLMDEPTNHLDLDSSERLAEALGTFDGTVLFVSHNRSFIRALATKIWFVDGGKVDVYPGNFDDYIASCQLGEQRERASTTTHASASATPARSEPQKRASREDEKARKREEARARAERNKKLRPLERRVAELEGRIAKLEESQKKRTDELGDPAVYQDASRREALMQAFAREKAELEVATDTWMEVQEELEALRAALAG